MPKETEEEPPRTLISRRDLLKSTVVLAASAPLTACFGRGARIITRPDNPETWPSYVLRRDVDELYVELLAIGYRERNVLGRRFLQRIAEARDAFLVFTMPPQHFIETAIPVAGIPASMAEAKLSTIALLPSQPSTLVFRVPDSGSRRGRRAVRSRRSESIHASIHPNRNALGDRARADRTLWVAGAILTERARRTCHIPLGTSAGPTDRRRMGGDLDDRPS